MLKECKYIEKKVVKHIHDSLKDFSYSSDESDKYWMLFDKYSNWLLFIVSLTCKYAYNV